MNSYLHNLLQAAYASVYWKNKYRKSYVSDIYYDPGFELFFNRKALPFC